MLSLYFINNMGIYMSTNQKHSTNEIHKIDPSVKSVQITVPTLRLESVKHCLFPSDFLLMFEFSSFLIEFTIRQCFYYNLLFYCHHNLMHPTKTKKNQVTYIKSSIL